jgi:predicted Zn-dependent protease
MIILTDTFNGRKISSHRTVEAAVKAEKKHLKAVKKANGSSSYLTYSIASSDGRDIGEEIDRARMSVNGW